MYKYITFNLWTLSEKMEWIFVTCIWFHLGAKCGTISIISRAAVQHVLVLRRKFTPHEQLERSNVIRVGVRIYPLVQASSVM